MRAVWVPFMSLDMTNEEQGEEAFRNKFSSIVQQAKQHGMNALIVHVRPFGDALYPSEFAPWSHLLTGIQGQDPGYDPLAIMVELTHRGRLGISCVDESAPHPGEPDTGNTLGR